MIAIAEIVHGLAFFPEPESPYYSDERAVFTQRDLQDQVQRHLPTVCAQLVVEGAHATTSATDCVKDDASTCSARRASRT